MNVTPETIGQSPWLRTTSSAPRPFWTVTIVASAKRPSSAVTAASRPVPFVATIATSNAGIAAGSAVAWTAVSKSARPETRRPRSSSACACSSRRVSTQTSATRLR